MYDTKTMQKKPSKKSAKTDALFSDPVMQSLHDRVIKEIGQISDFEKTAPQEYFWHMCDSIIGQQLSEKVAPIIRDRVKKVLQDKLTPEQVLATQDADLRAAGLSFSKISYLKNVARFWQSEACLPEKFSEMSAEELIVLLTQIKGVGRWTVEMFLIFTLGHKDVFSPGDFALKKAIMRHYKLAETTKPKEFDQFATQWSPNRSLASRVLWKSLLLAESN